jgi:hypothetical protein
MYPNVVLEYPCFPSQSRHLQRLGQYVSFLQILDLCMLQLTHRLPTSSQRCKTYRLSTSLTPGCLVLHENLMLLFVMHSLPSAQHFKWSKDPNEVVAGAEVIVSDCARTDCIQHKYTVRVAAREDRTTRSTPILPTYRCSLSC